MSSAFLNAMNQSISGLRPGSLCFWGDWFGKPYDNIHRVTSVEWTEEFDVIFFQGGESLLVKNPRNWSFAGRHLLIEDADVVRFQWFYYGRTPSPDTLQFVEYRRVGDSIGFSTDFMPGEGSRSVDSSKPAVELHPA